jgi:CheY-like chemotaxis protein
VLRLVVNVLRQAGYTVLGCATGAEAIALARAHVGTIDLLLTDVVMPDVRGPEVARQVAALRPGVGTLFMSGFDDAGGMGASTPLLAKPFSPAQLLSLVGRVLDERRDGAKPLARATR